MSLIDGLVAKIQQTKEFIFFTDERIGLEGRTFTIYKFRTMQRGREQERAVLLEHHGRDKFGYIIDDPRITYFGRYLRLFWIDEIPQIWNIIKRDMNLVGPRPLMLEEHESLPPDLRKLRDAVRPGLVPVTYADYFAIRSHEDRWKSERKYFDEREKNHLLTDARYLIRALATMAKLARGNFVMEMYQWTNSYPYLL